MKLKQQHAESVRELAKLIRSSRTSLGLVELGSDLESIGHILFDSGTSFHEQMFIVCSVVSQDSFCNEDSDVLFQIANDQLDGELEDDFEVGQLAINLVKGTAQRAIQELSRLKFAKAVAVIAKLGLLNPKFVGSIVWLLEIAYGNSVCLGD